MHKRRKYILLIATIATALFFVSGSLFAQLSDEQVIREAIKYKEQGMSQAQIFQELSKKGVTLPQFQRIKERIERQNGNNLSTTSQPRVNGNRQAMRESSEIDSTLLRRKRNLSILPEDTISPQNRIFGHDFFSRENLTFAPNMNMPTPANYILGSGDEVIIDVWGDSELNLQYTIAPDGYINVPGLGRIQLSGMTVEQATSRIQHSFSSIYSDLESDQPRTFLGISVGNTRTVNINVMGEVVQPGTYTMTSFASAFHALYAAGGPNKIGSLRNIRVFRNGEVAATIDIYEYLMNGNNMGDITLRDGDVVKVEPFGIIAQIIGETKRPMKYEMRPEETLNDLIRFAGGFAGKAYRKNVLVERKGETDMESYTVTEDRYSRFALHDGDVVKVGDILDKFSNAVEILGAVNRPGKYAIGDRLRTLKDLVNMAQGPTGDAYLPRALLYREKEDLTQTMESIDLQALLENRIPDVVLKKNDRFFVSSVIGLTDSLTVYIGGEVRNPGQYPFAMNLSVEDIILQAGGLTEAASTARIDVFRRIKAPSSTEKSNTTGEFFTFSLKDGLIMSGNKEFTLEPFDQVVVRRSPGYEPQQSITIQGEVLFAGQYAKLYKDERLSSFIKRAGGFTDQAYVRGARLMRKLNESEIQRAREALKAKAKISKDSIFIDKIDLSSQYVGIDLEKAMKKSGEEDDIILRDGDVITVPYYEGTVKISGAVLYPNTVTYNKRMSLQSYIRQAGGYSRLAMKSKPYVVYMNGKVASGRWAKIEPGCEIVVPEKPEREPMSLQAILSISTSIASLALLVTNLVK